MRAEANAIIAWYNTCRPHTALGGRTPDERYRRVASACRRPRWEPRPRWPSDSSCASPQVKVRGKQGINLQLVMDFHQGRKHLPVVTLRQVAWQAVTKNLPPTTGPFCAEDAEHVLRDSIRQAGASALAIRLPIADFHGPQRPLELPYRLRPKLVGPPHLMASRRLVGVAPQRSCVAQWRTTAGTFRPP